jgi:hypothetical protein
MKFKTLAIELDKQAQDDLFNALIKEFDVSQAMIGKGHTVDFILDEESNVSVQATLIVSDDNEGEKPDSNGQYQSPCFTANMTKLKIFVDDFEVKTNDFDIYDRIKKYYEA